MYTLILQMYNLVLVENCYTQFTQLVIYKDRLEILLERPETQYCDFPSGVMAQLQFPDSTLNLAQIYSNFSYLQTNALLFHCVTCELYQDVQQASIIIDSVQATSFFSIGIVSNKRKDAILQIESHILQSSDKICMILSATNIGYNIDQKQVQLTISINNNPDTIFITYIEEFTATVSKYCFVGQISVQKFKNAELQICGTIKGIITNEIYQTNLIFIEGQPEITNALSSTVYSNFFYIGLKYLQPDYDDFVNTKDINTVQFTSEYLINSEIMYITGKLNPRLVQNTGNIVCDVTDDPDHCRNVMTKVKSQPVSLRKCVFFLDFDSEIIKQEVTKWRTTCFDGANMVGYKNQISLDLTYEQSSIKNCVLLESQQIIIKLGYFNDSSNFIDSLRGFTVFKEFKYEWSGLQQHLELKVDEQDNFQILKNKKYTGIFIYDKNGNFMDQVQGQIEINMVQEMRFILGICITVNTIICLVVLFLTVNLKPNTKRKHQVKQIEKDEI